MNKNGYGFTFRGLHSSYYGLYVKSEDSFLLPSREKERLSIPSRAGEYVIESEPGNRNLTFLLTLPGQIINRRRVSRDVASWLSGKGHLILDYEPDLRYEVVSTVDNVSANIGLGRDIFTVTFECEPYRYGEERFYSGPGFFAENRGTAVCETIIDVSGSGMVSVTGGGEEFTLSNVTEPIVLDSRRMFVYSTSMRFMTHLHHGGFIRIPPGGASITVTNGSAAMRYWEMWK